MKMKDFAIVVLLLLCPLSSFADQKEIDEVNRILEEDQKKNKLKAPRWKAGRTLFTDMTENERKKYGGLVLEPNRPRREKKEHKQ
jgi:hypothetical protein